MNCPKCKRPGLRRQVSIFVECDAENMKLSKQGIRSKDVQILGADWPRSKELCTHCGWFLCMDEPDKKED